MSSIETISSSPIPGEGTGDFPSFAEIQAQTWCDIVLSVALPEIESGAENCRLDPETIASLLLFPYQSDMDLSEAYRMWDRLLIAASTHDGASELLPSILQQIQTLLKDEIESQETVEATPDTECDKAGGESDLPAANSLLLVNSNASTGDPENTKPYTNAGQVL